MRYTKEEIMEYVKQEDVKFIRLAFCDVFGRRKNLAILPTELERAFGTGMEIDASAIDGFDDGLYTDLFLVPDPATMTLLPWRSQNGKVIQMFCDIVYPDGSPFECNSREILKNAVRKAEEKGISFEFGSYMEFYLFQTDENGKRTEIPYDRAGYMDVAPADKGENVRREICLALEQMGIVPRSSHHEEGPGQNEIDFKNADPLTAANQVELLRTAVESVACGNGLFADFSPKPLAEEIGSGFHIHFAVKDANGENLLPFMIAGIFEKIREMTVFLNPRKRSYKRLGKLKAPSVISWSKGNCGQLIRVSSDEKKAELRSPDPMANPYLAFALLINAGLYGIENRLDCPKPIELDYTKATEADLAGLSRLPRTRVQAAEEAANSDFIRQIIPHPILAAYFERCLNKRMQED